MHVLKARCFHTWREIKYFIMAECLYWLSTSGFLLQLYPVPTFKPSVVVIFAAQPIIRHPSCGKLFHCCRFTLWFSTKAQECNARICSTQLLSLTRMRLVWRELNREILAKRLFIHIFYFALGWNIACGGLKYFNNYFHSGHRFYASLWRN